MGSGQQICDITRCAKIFLSSQQPIVLALESLLLLLACAVAWIVVQRRLTKWQLERRGFPTTMWMPRFIRYLPFEEDHKLSSSTITRILPRMERLGGPFGMYGTIYGLNTPVIHVAHPIPARAIFGANVGASSTVQTATAQRRNSSLACSTGASKAPAYDHFKNFCGEGVFTANGDDWKAKRAAVMHCLVRGTNSSKSDLSRRLEREANRAADTFIAQVSNLRQGSTSTNDSVVTNIVPLLQRSTVALIYRLITHHEPLWGIPAHGSDDEIPDSSLETSDQHEREKGTQESTNYLLDLYLKSIVRIRMIVLAQSRSIWFVLPRWCYSSFSSLSRDEETTLLPIQKFSQQACECARPGSPLALLQTMESHNKRLPGNLHSKTPKSAFSQELLDEAITLLFAGQDTSAATLSWTLHLLSIHPEIQSRLSTELKSVILTGDNGKFKKVGIPKHLITKLPFLDAVIKESMRLYPVAPFVVRRIQEEIFISDSQGEEKGAGNFMGSLPAGCLACIWIYGLHRNPKFWDRPNDFLPDRWLRDPKDMGQTNGAYMPFAAGPRNCLGQPIAHLVLRTILARLILQFEFRDKRLDEAACADDIRIDMQAGFTVLPSGGVSVCIRPRA